VNEKRTKLRRVTIELLLSLGGLVDR